MHLSYHALTGAHTHTSSSHTGMHTLTQNARICTLTHTYVRMHTYSLTHSYTYTHSLIHANTLLVTRLIT